MATPTQRVLRHVDRAPSSANLKSFSRSFSSKSAFPHFTALPRQRLKPAFFLSNSLLARANGTSTAPPAAASSAETPDPQLARTSTDTELLPHRRRQAAKRNAAAANGTQTAPSSTTTPSPSTNSMVDSLAPDASSRLADTAAQAPAHSLRRYLSALLSSPNRA
ncbi:Protoheme IX farnesyltransferase, mitochondrial [Collariella sp. IMI 366227]|nr:Protoheme IX farnesyltransferase, mitochondrial [Collariella sp. IMI 366227]